MFRQNGGTTPTLFAVGADFGASVVQLGHLGQFFLYDVAVGLAVAVSVHCGFHDTQMVSEFL